MIVNSIRINPVIMLVKSAGLSFPRIEGMRAIVKTREPAEKTISCHTIFLIVQGVFKIMTEARVNLDAKYNFASFGFAFGKLSCTYRID